MIVVAVVVTIITAVVVIVMPLRDYWDDAEVEMVVKLVLHKWDSWD